MIPRLVCQIAQVLVGPSSETNIHQFPTSLELFEPGAKKKVQIAKETYFLGLILEYEVIRVVYTCQSEEVSTSILAVYV